MMWALGGVLWIFMLLVLALGIVMFGGLYVYDKSIVLCRGAWVWIQRVGARRLRRGN
jgi:hypothetical protein